MDPEARRNAFALTIDDAVAADQMFTTLMVMKSNEPRSNFIQKTPERSELRHTSLNIKKWLSKNGRAFRSTVFF